MIQYQVISVHIWKQIIHKDVFWVQVQTTYNLLLPVLVLIKKPKGEAPAIKIFLIQSDKENVTELLLSLPLSKIVAAVVEQMSLSSRPSCSKHFGSSTQRPTSNRSIVILIQLRMKLRMSPTLIQTLLSIYRGYYRVSCTHTKIWRKDIHRQGESDPADPS